MGTDPIFWLLGTTAFMVASAANGATPGERFRAAMAERKAWCANSTRSPGDRTCDILDIKPADPLATPEGRLAHSIRLPSPLDKPADVHRPGMASEEYFRALCAAEAGEFIFATATDVEGVLQMRPRRLENDVMRRHLYGLEDPYGHADWKARDPQVTFVGPGRYRFLEQPLPGTGNPGRVIRYEGYDGRNLATMRSERDTAQRSKYGFIWRGISRPNDRELGIAGGEQIILELQSGAVLAVKRGFVRSGDFHVSPGVLWTVGELCPGDPRDLFSTRNFITKVLRPVE